MHGVVSLAYEVGEAIMAVCRGGDAGDIRKDDSSAHLSQSRFTTSHRFRPDQADTGISNSEEAADYHMSNVMPGRDTGWSTR